MQITTEEIRKATDVLLSHLEKTGHATVDVDQDCYWSIAPEQRYDPYTRPNELSMGQLMDDWVEVSGGLTTNPSSASTQPLAVQPTDVTPIEQPSDPYLY